MNRSFQDLWRQTLFAARESAAFLALIGTLLLAVPTIAAQYWISGLSPEVLTNPERLLSSHGPHAWLPLVFVALGGFAVVAQYLTCRKLQEGGSQSLMANGLLAALAASFLAGAAILIGLLLLIVPGLWLIGRLSMTVPAVADGTDNPISAIAQSWNRTRGHGWRITGWLLLLFLGYFLVSLGVLGISSGIGFVLSLALGPSEAHWSPARWIVETINASVSAGFGILYAAFLSSVWTSIVRPSATQPN